MSQLPKISSGLSITEVADETIVYDSKTNKAHCLDLKGGRVFAACKAGLSYEELEKELGSQENISTIIEELQGLDLLEKDGLSRRQVLAGASAGIASVLVASVVAPTAAAANSLGCRANLANPWGSCDCSQCGQPCSGTIRADNCDFRNPITQIPLPSTGNETRCCFWYQWNYSSLQTSETSCTDDTVIETFHCREVNSTGYNKYNYFCDDARKEAYKTALFITNTVTGEITAQINYYCCCCGNPKQPKIEKCCVGDL